MKATDFRIGNLVYYHIEDYMDERNQWDEVSSIDYDDLRILTEFKDNSEYKPIPLTEEWLKKSGFKKMELKYLSGIKTGWILEDDTLYPFILGEYFQPIIQINGFSENIDIGSPLMFLHRLQNCYYVLKEKELIIK